MHVRIPRSRLNQLVLPAALLALGLTEATSYAAPAFPRYDQIQMYSPHNSFQKWQDPSDILSFYNIRSMEWDVHAAPLLPDIPSDWQIWHTDDVVARDLNTHCLNMEDCVRQVKGFHDIVPMHEVITIYMDTGDNPTFAGFADTTAMDQLLESVLGRGAIFTPSDLLATCPDLRLADDGHAARQVHLHLERELLRLQRRRQRRVARTGAVLPRPLLLARVPAGQLRVPRIRWSLGLRSGRQPRRREPARGQLPVQPGDPRLCAAECA
jgi:hypothetical protein